MTKTPIQHHGIFLLTSLLFFLLSPEIRIVGAQTPPENEQYPNYARFSPSMAIIIVVLIAALFFMGFFSIYIRHCSDSSGAAGSIRRALSIAARRAAARGLDQSVIETFPTFSYSEVKDHKIGNGALECAVCLNEFQDDETLRLLPKCDHVFHPECIDAWLESHVTCPVCRANLAPQPGDDQPVVQESEPACEVQIPEAAVTNNNISIRDEIVIQVENEAQLQEQGAAPVKRSSSFEYPTRPPRSWSIRRPSVFGFGRFRSHSTGHSLVQPGENLDRFTLRLPKEVRKEVLDRAALNRIGSSAATLPRERSSRRGYRTGGGEGSGRSGRFYGRIERSDREAKSDRWAFFTRGLSMRSTRVVAEAGESSGGGVGGGAPPVVKMPSFKCLEPKADDESGLISSDHQGKPPV